MAKCHHIHSVVRANFFVRAASIRSFRIWLLLVSERICHMSSNVIQTRRNWNSGKLDWASNWMHNFDPPNCLNGDFKMTPDIQSTLVLYTWSLVNAFIFGYWVIYQTKPGKLFKYCLILSINSKSKSRPFTFNIILPLISILNWFSFSLSHSRRMC